MSPHPARILFAASLGFVVVIFIAGEFIDGMHVALVLGAVAVLISAELTIAYVDPPTREHTLPAASSSP